MTSLREGNTPVVKREDYAAPAYFVDTVELCFDLDPAKTRVLNKMRLRRNPAVAAQPLRLDGEELNLARVLVNGEGSSFKMDGKQLVLEKLPEGAVRSKWQARASSDLAQVIMALDCASSDLAQVMMALDCDG